MRNPSETKIKIILALLALAWNLSNACLSAPLPAKKVESGWTLTQAHFAEKLLSLRVSNHGLRIDALKATWGVICVAPDWDVVIFSNGDKTICRVPYKNWSIGGFRMYVFDDVPVLPKIHSVRTTRDSIGPYGELPVTQLTWKGLTSSAEDMMFQAQVRPRKCSYQLETTPLIVASPQARLLLMQLYHLPPISEFPIRFLNSVDSRPRLQTIELRKVDLASDVFTPPVGYRSVKTENEVWVDADDKAKIDDLGEMMGAPGK